MRIGGRLFYPSLRMLKSRGGDGEHLSDSALNGARSCTRVGPMGHESHAGPRSRTTHAPALTPDLTLSTECRFIIGHKLRRKNLEGNSIRCRALGFAFYWAIPTSCSVLEPGRHARLLDVTRNFHLFSPFYTIIPYITAYGKIYKRDKFFRIYFSREIMELFQQD